jgi:hypothetical protein
VAEQASAKSAVQVTDGGQQGAKQPDLGTDQLGENFRGQTDRRGGDRAEPGEKLGGTAATAVGIPAAEGRQTCLAQPGRCLWGRVGLQESQGDL